MLLASSILAGGCSKPARHAGADARRPTTVVVSRPDIPADASIVQIHMRDRYRELLTMQRNLVVGDLSTVRAYALSLAIDQGDVALDPFSAEMKRLRSAAESLGASSTTGEATRRLPVLAATCGRCHRNTGAAVDIDLGRAPPDGPDALARMLRHQWAADQLWQGLIADSDQRWRDGLAVLSVTPLPEVELARVATERAAPRIERLGRQLQNLARRSRTVGSLERRAVAYGEILAVCAGCHELARGAPASQ